MATKALRHPKGLDFPAQYIADLGLYLIRSDPFNSTDSTGETIMFDVPAGTYIHSIGWDCSAAWADSQIAQPVILVGDTATRDLYGMLGQAQLGSTQGGSWPLYFESTADSKIALYVVSQGGKVVATPTAGAAELWVMFRPVSESIQNWIVST